MSERDELPDGWKFGGWFGSVRRFWAHNEQLMTPYCAGEAETIAAAWRIVDAEKESEK